VSEQRYKAVLAVIGDGRTVTEVARDWGVNSSCAQQIIALTTAGPSPVEGSNVDYWLDQATRCPQEGNNFTPPQAPLSRPQVEIKDRR